MSLHFGLVYIVIGVNIFIHKCESVSGFWNINQIHPQMCKCFRYLEY